MMQTPHRTYNGLQALRMIAAMLVVVTHSTFYTWERLDSSLPVWYRGAVGVELFFVLSGFVMIYSSARLMNVADGWKVFAERRIVRIVPMYWLATTLKLAIMLLSTGLVLHAKLGLTTILGSYLFVPSRGANHSLLPLLAVGWTLNFEMFFYFLFDLALLLKANVYGLVGVVLAGLSVGSFFMTPARIVHWPGVSFYLNSIVLDFFFGMLIAAACLKRKHLPKWLAVPLLPLGFYLLLVCTFGGHRVPFATGIAAGLVVWATVALEDYLRAIPRWILFLADASYAIYLFHPLLAPLAPLLLLRLHLVNGWLAVMFSIATSLVVGSAIHLYVEKPITEFFREHLRLSGRKVIHAPS